jgi:DNA-binding NarL/FixJ family response regulator
MINVILVDDHALFLLGVKTAIAGSHPDLRIVGEARTGAEFFRLMESVTADIVLLDIGLPDMSGIEIARRLKQERSAIKILAISAENTGDVVQAMLDIGIEGFISKSASDIDMLAEAIRSVISGFEYFGKDISAIIYRVYIAKKKTAEVGPEFTEQERRVIELCHEGLSGKMIAERLGIATKTVDNYKNNIFRKLGINSTLEMVNYALKKGIIRMG